MVHHLPVVTHAEMNVLLKAIQAFAEVGALWSAAKWSKELGRKLPLFHSAGPTTVLPTDHQEFTEDPQVSFAAMSSPEFLKGSTVKFHSLDPEDDSLEFTVPSKNPDASTSSKDLTVFTFCDPSGKVGSPFPSRPRMALSPLKLPLLPLMLPMLSLLQSKLRTQRTAKRARRMTTEFVLRSFAGLEATAQLNASRHLPVHKDKSNRGRTWLFAIGDYEGGRLWVESPVGSHAPPTAKCEWQQ